MWEVFSLGKQPYDLYDNSQVVIKVSQGHRLYQPQLASDTIYQIMYSCWHEASTPLSKLEGVPTASRGGCYITTGTKFFQGKHLLEKVKMALGFCPEMVEI